MINHLKKAFRRREHLYSNSKTNCFRVFNSISDGIEGLTIDLYGQFFLVQYYNKHIDSLLNDSFSLKNDILNSIPSIPENIKGVLMKNRTPVADTKNINRFRRSLLIDGEYPPENYHVRQNGILAYVDLINGQNTGIFLDMREVRDNLQQLYISENFNSMLNLFCYTSLFSVHALKNGIDHSTNVDLSKAVLKRAVNNYHLNGLKVDQRDFIYGDSIRWIKTFRKRGERFSFIVYDPPTFSRNKKRTFSIRNNFSQSLMLLNDISEGYILTSINSLSVSKDEYFSYHPKNWNLEMFQNESSDFKYNKKPYLKAGLWRCN